MLLMVYFIGVKSESDEDADDVDLGVVEVQGSPRQFEV